MTAHSYSESVKSQSSASKFSLNLILFWVANLPSTLFDIFLPDLFTEPKITELQGRNGESFWEIYDARTGRTIYCMTEDEVMEWLDNRHYRQ